MLTAQTVPALQGMNTNDYDTAGSIPSVARITCAARTFCAGDNGACSSHPEGGASLNYELIALYIESVLGDSYAAIAQRELLEQRWSQPGQLPRCGMFEETIAGDFPLPSDRGRSHELDLALHFASATIGGFATDSLTDDGARQHFGIPYPLRLAQVQSN